MRRRDFLKNGGLIVGGLGLGSACAGAVAPSDRVNVGVIGTGVRGQQLIGFLAASPEFRVVACCDVLPFRLDEAQALTGGGSRAYDDYRRLLGQRDIDAVVIATPFHHHHTATLDALSAHKDVYCEKSMAKGIDESLAVVRAAQASDRVVQVGFQYHDSPLYRAAAAMIADGELGDITAVNCQWNRNGDWRRPVPDPKWERQINWRMYREYSSGLVAELSAHQMDFCNWILPGGVERIQGVGGIDYWRDGRETYDNIHVVCRYGGGITATFASLTTNSLGSYRISVLGSRGSIELTTRRGWYFPEVADTTSPNGVDLVSGASVYATPGAYRSADTERFYRIDAPDTDPTPFALQAFAAAVRERSEPVSNVRTGAIASIMVQMAVDAMDTGDSRRWRPDYDVSG